MPPAAFIGLAEDNGFIVKIGEWVLQEANRAIREFNKVDNAKQMHLSVNVSLKQLQTSEFYDVVKKALVGIDPKQLILEITEHVMAVDVEFTLQMLQKIQSLGVRICMDDFGTGYSSLSYLREFPINTIKIDKTFVDVIPKEGQERRILIDTIIAMANTLDKFVIAEGVEEEYQLEYLKQRGCQYFQGYLYSKPIEESAYLQLLQKRLS